MHLQVPPFKKTLTEELPYVDYLFGNETEAAAFAESEGWDANDLHAVASKVWIVVGVVVVGVVVVCVVCVCVVPAEEDVDERGCEQGCLCIMSRNVYTIYVHGDHHTHIFPTHPLTHIQ